MKLKLTRTLRVKFNEKEFIAISKAIQHGIRSGNMDLESKTIAQHFVSMMESYESLPF